MIRNKVAELAQQREFGARWLALRFFFHPCLVAGLEPASQPFFKLLSNLWDASVSCSWRLLVRLLAWFELVQRRSLPNADLSIGPGTARINGVAVPGEYRHPNVIVVAVQGRDFHPTIHIPDLQGLVAGPSYQPRPVRREVQTCDEPYMSDQGPFQR